MWKIFLWWAICKFQDRGRNGPRPLEIKLNFNVFNAVWCNIIQLLFYGQVQIFKFQPKSQLISAVCLHFSKICKYQSDSNNSKSYYHLRLCRSFGVIDLILLHKFDFYMTQLGDFSLASVLNRGLRLVRLYCERIDGHRPR